MNPYFVLVAGWLVYFVILNFLGSLKKLRALFCITGAIALLFYDDSIHSLNFFTTEGPMRWVSMIFTIFGMMVIQTSFRKFKVKEFTELESVRHPIHSGVILLVLGFFFFIPNLPTLISCVCILVYVPIGLYLEEKKLVATYGDQYIEYRKRVPAIIPDKLLKEIS
ncbi:MAG: hypothetical protein WDO15_09380 [Bacteroidota bacterium]